MTEKLEVLRNYFQQGMPDCQVNSQWHDDFGWRRFYFVKDGKNQYILDVGRNVLDGWSASELVEHLEAAKWQDQLQGHAHQVAGFTQNGFVFNPWPS
jgi:hypothetical protein